MAGDDAAGVGTPVVCHCEGVGGTVVEVTDMATAEET